MRLEMSLFEILADELDQLLGVVELQDPVPGSVGRLAGLLHGSSLDNAKRTPKLMRSTGYSRSEPALCTKERGYNGYAPNLASDPRFTRM